MIVSFYIRTVDELLVRPFWVLRIWAHRHPLPFRFLLAAIIVVFIIGWPTIAFAADDSPIAMLPGINITDSTGTPVWRYTMLPLDRGNGLDGKVLVTGPLDFLWALHIFVVSWMVWLCQWVISFEWVDWIAMPFVAIADAVQSIFARLNWIPLALAIAGGVGAFAVMMGRVGKGVGELIVSAMCAVLAIGFFANPVSSITEDGGFLDTAKEFGSQLAIVVVTDDTTAVNQDPGTALQDAVTGQLVDIFIRTPSQVLSFGRPLEGQCAATFDEQMKGGYAWESGFLGLPSYGEVTIDDVRDSVRDCDAAAKSFNENPNFLSVITMIAVNQGSTSIFFLPGALFVLFVLAVMGGMWAGLKTMWWMFVGILPINRSALWRAALDTVIGISSIVLLTVFLAGALRFTGAMMEMIAAAGVPLVVQMGVVQVATLVIIFMLVRAKMQAHRAGRTLAEHLARYGVNGGVVPPKQNMAAAIIGGGIASSLINGGSKVLAARATRPAMNFDARSINMFGGSGTPDAGGEPINMPVVSPNGPAGGSGGRGPTVPGLPGAPSRPQLTAGGPKTPTAASASTGKAAKRAAALGRVATGATGGWAGVAASAAKEVGRGAAEKAATSAVKGAGASIAASAGSMAAEEKPSAPKAGRAPGANRPAIVLPSTTTQSNAPTRNTHRIRVDANGVAHVVPRPGSPRVVHDISSLPRPTGSRAGSQQLRDRLSGARALPPRQRS